MKILYFLDGLNRGGVEIIVAQLANYFYEKGHEIHIVYLYKDMDDLRGEFTAGINIHPLPFNKNKKPYLQYFKYFRVLVNLLKVIRPDIIHANNSSFSYFFLASAVRFSKLESKNIRTLHFMGFFFERKNRLDKVRFFFDKRASKLLQTTIVSVSESIKCFVDKYFSSNKSVLITNGIDTQKIVNTEISREVLGVRPNRFVCIYVSRICEGKNHRLLLKAWTRVVELYPCALLILVGDGPLRLECENYCKTSGLVDNILFTGSVSNVAEYLKISDIGVFPSESEGFGLGLCEMMAAGLSVVASDIPVFRTMVQDGHNGILFDTYNFEDLSSKIITLIRSDRKRDELGENAYKYAIRHFTLHSMLEKYQKLYQKE